MTVTSLVTAVALGIAIGGAAWILLRVSREIPVWLPLASAVGAAVLGTIVVRLTGLATAGMSLLELLVQIVSAGAGAVLVAVTADRPAGGRTTVTGASERQQH